MTPAESELLSVHTKYWGELANRGTAILFGPVADPKGAWGLAVVEVKDEAEANSLGVNDPVIKANAGFSFEMLLPRLTLRR
jgi:uncharacterized protein YciI